MVRPQIGKELTIDIAYYRTHPGYNHLWCVICDPDKLIPNVAGLVGDLSGVVQSPQGSETVRAEVVSEEVIIPAEIRISAADRDFQGCISPSLCI